MRKNIFILGCLALFLAACGGLQSTPIPTTEAPTALPTSTSLPTAIPVTPIQMMTATPVVVDVGPQNFPSGYNPLTGLPVTNPALLNRRPLSVKIQLYPRPERPPYGISQADIVFDYYHNNGMDRLNAIFLGNDAKPVGPIRSARLFDQSIIRMYKVDFAFGSADARIIKILLSQDFAKRLVVEGAATCPVMCRIDPKGYNFLTTDTQELGNYVAKRGVDNGRQNLDGMTFKVHAPDGGKAGAQIFTRYSISAYNRWDYDMTSGRYLRFEDNQEASGQGDETFAPLIDANNNLQAAADNVVVIMTPHKYYYKSNTGDSEIIEINLKESGIGYAFRDGKVYQVTWQHPKEDAVLTLTLSDGSPYPFKPGVTWFQIVGLNSKLTSTDAGVWRFESSIP